MIRNIIQILVLIVLIVFSIVVWEKIKNFRILDEDKINTSHHILLKEMTNMGKLELIKYSYRDVVEQEIVRDFLPDPKAILIVQGEAVGCLDLTLIKEKDIYFKGDTIIVNLPDPEICNNKIDHSKSKIYKTDFAFLNEALLLDEAYKKAENQILESALSSDILDQTKKNAETLLKPLIENLSGKKVVIHFQLNTKLNKLK